MANMSNIFRLDMSKRIGPISSFANGRTQLQCNSVMHVGSQVNDELGQARPILPRDSRRVITE